MRLELLDAVSRVETIAIGPGILEGIMKQATRRFALCVDNTDYATSLIVNKVYAILPNPAAARDDLLRIVDESGEDYLYHKSHFVLVDFPKLVERRILDAAVAV